MNTNVVGSQYTDAHRREAVMLYAMHGHDTHVAKLMDIPRSTIQHWRKADWWDDMLSAVRHEIQDRHISMYQRITDKALDAAVQRIDEATPQQLVTMAAISTDKARLLSNQPTSIRGDSSTINDLAQQFAKLSQQWEEKQVNVVSTQSPSDTSDSPSDT